VTAAMAAKTSATVSNFSLSKLKISRRIMLPNCGNSILYAGGHATNKIFDKLQASTF
jgi:hypothetical protein